MQACYLSCLLFPAARLYYCSSLDNYHAEPICSSPIHMLHWRPSPPPFSCVFLAYSTPDSDSCPHRPPPVSVCWVCCRRYLLVFYGVFRFTLFLFFICLFFLICPTRKIATIPPSFLTPSSRPPFFSHTLSFPSPLQNVPVFFQLQHHQLGLRAHNLRFTFIIFDPCAGLVHHQSCIALCICHFSFIFSFSHASNLHCRFRTAAANHRIPPNCRSVFASCWPPHREAIRNCRLPHFSSASLTTHITRFERSLLQGTLLLHPIESVSLRF